MAHIAGNRRLKIAIIGAGSAFTINLMETLTSEVFRNCECVLMDVTPQHLERALVAARKIVVSHGIGASITGTTNLDEAVDGADYVIVSCEQDRYRNWVKDITIPERHGVFQVTGENGGPGGMIHAVRNIGMMSKIVAAMERGCPQAWLLNLTNPMSVLCTYLARHTRLKYAGFCHQVHGTFGVIAEQLGFEPGELQVVSAGINHLNWLFDLRRKSTGENFLPTFLERINQSKWWQENHPNVPEHGFSLEIAKTFGMYPVGYDNHICEYLSCFYEKSEWEARKIASHVETHLQEYVVNEISTMEQALKAQHLMLGGEAGAFPFPQDPAHPYYHESLCPVIEALETNVPLYLDAMVGPNNGAISNLPNEAVVDRPVLVVGGDLRSVHVGALPAGPHEVCRRQIALHEMIVQATVGGDESLAVQALCLDPYVASITQARAIWRDFRQEYRDMMPSFA